MNLILQMLMVLEDKIAKAEKEGKLIPIDFVNKKRIEEGYTTLQKELSTQRDAAPKQSKSAQRAELGLGNVGNVVRNLFDNTVGYGIATYQNKRTIRELKNNSEAAKKYMTVLVPGLFQNIGSQWRLARLERKKGRLAYHVHPNNGLEKKAREKKAIAQLEELKRKTGKNPYKLISGHSDGAALGIGIVQSEKAVKEHNIYAVQARAPSVHGVTGDYTLGQKMLIPIAPNDNVKKSYMARRGAFYNAKMRPHAKVYVVAGEYDGLVKPRDAVYKHAEGHYLAQGKKSTHFGTSGGNPTMNRVQSQHIDDIVKGHKTQIKQKREAARKKVYESSKPKYNKKAA